MTEHYEALTRFVGKRATAADLAQLERAKLVEWVRNDPGCYRDAEGITQRNDRYSLGLTRDQWELEYEIRRCQLTEAGALANAARLAAIRSHAFQSGAGYGGEAQ